MKPIQVHTTNYQHFWNPGNSLMPGGNKKS